MPGLESAVMDGGRAHSRAGRRFGLLVSFAISEALVLLAILGPLIGLPWWRGFRGYFSYDQLAYAGIATNVAVGELRPVEPFTVSGSSYYPSLWYELIGLISRVTTFPVHLVWTVLGLVAVSAAVLTVGWLAFRVSDHDWAPVLPALSLFTGTLAILTTGNWYAPLGEHAALWGPLGTLFTLNGEAAGLSLGVVAISLLVLASWDIHAPVGRRSRHVLVAAVLVGVIANIHTYSFFMTLFAVVAFVAVRSLLTRRSRTTVLVTLGLAITVAVAGRLVAPETGPLPVFALVLLVAVPALLPEAKDHPRLAVGTVALASILAAPQVVRTAWGLVSDDPFLTYRQVSTVNLGVASTTTLVASIPVVLLVAACATALWRSRQTTLQSLVIALVVGLIVLSANDLWGFNQEPYRFWLQSTILLLLFCSAVLSWAIVNTAAMARTRRVGFAVLVAAAVLTWTVGLLDVLGFWAYARHQGVVAMADPRLDAARALLDGHDGLVMSSACLSPGTLKNATAARVAAYNKGLAWPPDVKAFEIFTDPNRRASEDPVALRAAGVQFVITDSACGKDWSFPTGQAVVPLDRQSYAQDGTEQTLTLWWVDPG
jgi:hypothetical protein